MSVDPVVLMWCVPVLASYSINACVLSMVPHLQLDSNPLHIVYYECAITKRSYIYKKEQVVKKLCDPKMPG